MSSELESKGSKRRIMRFSTFAGGALILVATVFGLWATGDRNWEQSWKHRVRVETPLGSDKAIVLSWLRRHSNFVPHVDGDCEDTLNGIPVVVLAGLRTSDVASFSRTTVRRSDLAARSTDHMRIYHFFGADGKVVGHFTLPFHEIAEYERSYRMLAAR